MGYRILSHTPLPIQVASHALLNGCHGREIPVHAGETADELLPESLFTHKYLSETILQAKHVFLKYIALAT